MFDFNSDSDSDTPPPRRKNSTKIKPSIVSLCRPPTVVEKKHKSKKKKIKTCHIGESSDDEPFEASGPSLFPSTLAAPAPSPTPPAPSPSLLSIDDAWQAYRRLARFSTPTPIQSVAWPLIAQGFNILLQSPTGSGKTLTYLLPLLTKKIPISNNNKPKTPSSSSSSSIWSTHTVHKPFALILCPTRELVQQVQEYCPHIERIGGWRSACMYGGTSLDRTAEAADVLVATPGRLLECCESGAVSLASLAYLVLDEADKMTEMGMGPQVAQILASLRSVPQTFLCSATLPRRLRALALRSFAQGAQQAKLVRLMRQGEAPTVEALEAGEEEGEGEGRGRERKHARSEDVSIREGITQEVQICAPHKKPRKLLRFIYKVRKEEKSAGGGKQRAAPSRMLVFINQIATATFLLRYLKEHTSESVGAIHSKMKQPDRDKVLRQFQSGAVTLLVATDVLGRGIHLENLPYVVNYDFPPNLLTYTHRIGRCAHQAQHTKPGLAYSFFTRNMAALGPDLLKLLRAAGQVIHPDFKKFVEDYQIDQTVIEPDEAEEKK